MSVIWSGITEGGAIVPVQVDESGKVIATADPRPELWTKTGEILTPTTSTDDIQTSGNLILNGASGSSTLTAADSAGVKIYALPETSGTLALVSTDPPPSSGAKPHAGGHYTASSESLSDSFGIRKASKQGNSTILLMYEKDMASSYGVINVSMYKAGSGQNAAYYQVVASTTASIQLEWFKDFSSNIPVVSFSFLIWDLGSLSSVRKSVPVEVIELPDDMESAA